jgi:Ca-activated chloride channel family protein
MKPAIPFLLLGTLGVAGVVTTGGGTGTTASLAPPPTAAAGPIRVEASLERTTLPANASGDTFVRVALTGEKSLENLQQQRPAVSLTLVIDRSGSMGSEQKMEAAEEAACAAVKALAPGDRYAVVSFDNGAEIIHQGEIASTSVTAACGAIAELSARGSTDMRAGLEMGGQAAARMQAPGRVNRMLVLSDGRPDSEAGLADQTAALARQGIVTTTIGLGTDYNEDLMSALADRGLGNSYFVESRSDHLVGGEPSHQRLAKIFKTELSSMTEVVAKAATVRLTPKAGFELVEVSGFVADKSGADLLVPVGDIYSGHTIEVLVRARHPAHQATTSAVDLVAVAVNAKDARTQAQVASALSVAATFSDDTTVVAAALVPAVAEEAEKVRTTQAMLSANEAYNRGDFAAGDRVLNEQKARVQTQARALGSAKLQALFDDVDGYQAQNASAGMGGRASMNKALKEKARDYARSAKK